MFPLHGYSYKIVGETNFVGGYVQLSNKQSVGILVPKMYIFDVILYDVFHELLRALIIEIFNDGKMSVIHRDSPVL